MNAEQRRAARPRVPLTELRSQAAAEELMDRLRDATRAVTDLGGWPPSDSFQHVVAGWLAEFGLTIDDDAVPVPGPPRVAVRFDLPQPDDG